MNHKKVMKLLDDEAGILIEKLPIIYESDIHEMRRRLKEVLNDFILETYSKGAVDIQETLFNEEEKIALCSSPIDSFSFPKFWDSYPKKAGKRKAKEIWDKEIASSNGTVIRVWNAFYKYLLDILHTRRQGFFRQFKDGDRFVRNYTDWIGFHDTMMTDINILIDKCEQLTKKIREEEESNLEVAKLKKQSIRLQDRYKEGW